MQGLLGSKLLELPVRLHGIALGRPLDLLLDGEGRRVVGIYVVCGDDAERFLPLAAAVFGADEIGVETALAVIDDADFYRKRGRTLAELKGSGVDESGVGVGVLEDVVVAADGTVTHLVLDGGRRLPLGDETRLAAAA